MAKLFGFSIEGADDNNLHRVRYLLFRKMRQTNPTTMLVVGFMVSTLILKVYSEMNMI